MGQLTGFPQHLLYLSVYDAIHSIEVTDDDRARGQENNLLGGNLHQDGNASLSFLPVGRRNDTVNPPLAQWSKREQVSNKFSE